MGLLGFSGLGGRRRAVAVVEEEATEEHEAQYHRECGHVVRTRRIDESLVLRVLQRTHWHLLTESTRRVHTTEYTLRATSHNFP